LPASPPIAPSPTDDPSADPLAPLTLEEREHLGRLSETARNFGLVGAARSGYLTLRRRGRRFAAAEERELRTRLDALDLTTSDGRASYRRVIRALASVLDDLALGDAR
jgi:hypothetical protein